MKIGITCHPSAGGSGILATELGIAMADRGHEVHFVTSQMPFRLDEFHENITFHTVTFPSYSLFQYPPYTLALANKIFEVAEEYGIEVWHAHYAVPHAICAILARDMLPEDKKFKVVTTLHGTDITLVGIDPSFFRLTRHSMKQSDAVTAVSDWLRGETQREFDLKQEVQTIYNFVDMNKFIDHPVKRCQLAEENEKIIMHISNFRPVKRVTDVVRAFGKILDKVNARLVMVGEGPELMAARGVAKQLGFADHVKFIGTNENIENLLPCADLVFQPSEHESFGLAHLEAMACRVPVLATDSGGVREVVEHGVTGYLCEVGDIESMAARAVEILSDSDLATSMGNAGRERVERLFGRDRAVDAYEALYLSLLAGQAVPAK